MVHVDVCILLLLKLALLTKSVVSTKIYPEVFAKALASFDDNYCFSGVHYIGGNGYFGY